jgi:hypothetical protein
MRVSDKEMAPQVLATPWSPAHKGVLVAFRAGELTLDGWVLKKWAVQDIIRKGRSLKPNEFGPDLKQKRVGMKIGLDVAW